MSRVLTLVLAFSVAPLIAAQSPAPQAPASPAKPAAPAAPRRPAAPAAPKAPQTPPKASAPASAATPAVAPATTPAPVASMSEEQKTIYALGLVLERSIQSLDLSADEVAIVVRGLTDAAAGSPAIDLQEWGPRIDPLAAERRVRGITREKTASAAYVDKAATAAGAIKTDSGMVYRELRPGIGAMPKAGDTVKVHYRGTLRNGTVFDSSYERNEPATFALTGVIPCWTEGLQRMRVGGQAQLVCPSFLAYGDTGNEEIPGGAALTFEVDLLEIVR